MFTYGTLCSGIASESVAWSHLGWHCKWFSEIDPFCNAFLAHKYPEVANLGDCTAKRLDEFPPVDLLCGGTPCQPFSVNGRRLGLADARGGPTEVYVELCQEMRPRWVIWENVPGAVAGQNAGFFREFVSALVGCGYGVCWRILNLRGFGVPHDRRRLFLVGHSGGAVERAAVVLFDPRGWGQDARQTGKVRGGDAGVGAGADLDVAGWTGDPTPKFVAGRSPTLRASQGGEGAGVLTRGLMRRFTVTEWERLMGFPDGYTDCPGATVKKRTHAIGNAYPVPVLRWLGERVAFVEEEIPWTR